MKVFNIFASGMKCVTAGSKPLSMSNDEALAHDFKTEQAAVDFLNSLTAEDIQQIEWPAVEKAFFHVIEYTLQADDMHSRVVLERSFDLELV